MRSITPVDTRLFRESYLETLSAGAIAGAVINKETMVIAKHFPYFAVWSILRKIRSVLFA